MYLFYRKHFLPKFQSTAHNFRLRKNVEREGTDFGMGKGRNTVRTSSFLSFSIRVSYTTSNTLVSLGNVCLQTQDEVKTSVRKKKLT